MNLDDFLEELQDILQRDDPVAPEMELSAIPEWDSLAMMGIASFFNTGFSIRVTRAELLAMRTVADIAARAGVEA